MGVSLAAAPLAWGSSDGLASAEGKGTPKEKAHRIHWSLLVLAFSHADSCSGCVVSSQHSSDTDFCVVSLAGGVRPGLIATVFLSMARRTRRGTDVVGWASSAIQLQNPSGMLKDSVNCSLDSTFCLGICPRVAIWFSGRCPVSIGDRPPCPCGQKKKRAFDPDWSSP